ncbi:MAG: hypothetical protein WA172_05260 [Terriglobales bacterium]
MKLSLVWLLIVLVLAWNGHLMTGAFFAFPWFFHRQWEKTLWTRQQKSVQSPERST